MKRPEDLVPRYVRIAAALRAAVDRGEYAPGARLPSIAALARAHEVSLVTAREAVRLLESEGCVVARQGRGTFVVQQGNGHRAVLVADDDREVRELLSDLVRAEGYHPIEARDTAEALAALERQQFSHIFTDLRMPGAGGATVLTRARERQPESMLIVVTGFPEDLAALPGVAGSSLLVLTKPFHAQQVRQALALRPVSR